MMSIFMLPISKLDRTKIFKNLVKKKIECHFLIENIKMSKILKPIFNSKK